MLVHLRRDPAPPGPAHSTPRALRCHRTRSRKNRRRSQEEQSGQQDEQRDHAVAGCSGVSSGRRLLFKHRWKTVGDDKPHFWEHMRSRAVLRRWGVEVTKALEGRHDCYTGHVHVFQRDCMQAWSLELHSVCCAALFPTFNIRCILQGTLQPLPDTSRVAVSRPRTVNHEWSWNC